MERHLFYLAIFLLVEPLLVLAWPRIKAGFILSGPGYWDLSDRIKDYYDRCRGNRFGIYSPFRRKTRICMWTFAILILLTLTANNMFNLNIL